MARKFKAGISFNDGLGQIAVLEPDAENVVLHYLGEFTHTNGSDLWFLHDVVDPKHRVMKKVSGVSVALDNKSVFLFSFPLDTSLNQTEQNEHVEWELSNFIEDFKPREYVHDTHVLRTNAREQVSDVLIVSVRRSLLFNIQHELEGRSIDLQFADAQHFGAQHALLTAHPETKNKIVALVGAVNNRLDIGIVSNGRLTVYRYGIVTGEQRLNLLRESIQDIAVSDVYLYGAAVLPEFVKTVRDALSLNVTMLDPFSRLTIASSFRDFDKFIGREHHFAASVGCALRKH
jgi:Tfp pilus assembly PilM family ATPase